MKSKKHQEFLKARRAVKWHYGVATITFDGIMIMYKGVPLGEIGWRYITYKVIRYMDTGGYLYNRREEVIIEEVEE